MTATEIVLSLTAIAALAVAVLCYRWAREATTEALEDLLRERDAIESWNRALDGWEGALAREAELQKALLCPCGRPAAVFMRNGRPWCGEER